MGAVQVASLAKLTQLRTLRLSGTVQCTVTAVFSTRAAPLLSWRSQKVALTQIVYLGVRALCAQETSLARRLVQASNAYCLE